MSFSRSLPVAIGVLVWSLLSPASAAVRTEAEPPEPGAGPETVPPSVRVSVLPPANAAGWHDAQVRLVYTCVAQSGVARCPDEKVVGDEGARQTVTAVVVDQAGTETTSSVTLSIDRTPPVLHMMAPTHGQVVTGTSVTVRGTVTDGLSGVAAARCNGAPATVIGDTVACTVAVRPGMNAVVLQVSDKAGNAAVAGVTVIGTVAPSRVTVAPENLTLKTGERHDLRLLNQAGVSVFGANWTANDSDVLSVAQRDAGVEVVALAPGTATVHADWNGLMAETVVTVVAAEGQLPYGTARASIRKLTPEATQKLFIATRVEADGPGFFVLETAPTAATLRTVSTDLTPLSVWSVPVEATMVLADRDGGVILSTGQSRGLLRLPGSEDARPWWYVPECATSIRGPVQSFGRTIFALETADDGFGTDTIVGLDVSTGTVMFRIPSLGRRHSWVLNGDGPGSVIDSGVRTAPMHTPVVGYDGAAYVGASIEELSVDRGTGLRTDRVEAHLMRIEPDGAASTTMMESKDATRPASDPWLTVTLGRVIPDPRGGAHIEWTYSSGSTVAETRHGRGGTPGAPTALQGSLPFSRVGDALTGYDEAGNAYDMDTSALRYKAPPGATFVSALVGGGAAYRVGTDLIQTDGAGTVVKTTSMPDMPIGARPIR